MEFTPQSNPRYWAFLWAKAIQIAASAHADQLDKAELVPHVCHPLEVANMVEGVEAKIVAILHDVIEDKGGWFEQEICSNFPQHIVDAIMAITKRKGEAYCQYIIRVCYNPIARKVKIADIKHNMSPARIKYVSSQKTKDYTDALTYLERAEILSVAQD